MKALIFDVDGTLAETEEAHRAAFNRAFESWDLPWCWSRELYGELLKTTGGKERILAFLQRTEAAGVRMCLDQVAEIHRLKTGYYEDILKRGGLPLRPGVKGLIHRARAAGLKIAVATTTSRSNVEALARCCWGKPAESVFDVVAAGDEVARKKPAPDVFLLALQRLGLDAQDCLAIEDSRNGVASARAAGLAVLVTPSAYTLDEDFSDAQYVVPTLISGGFPQELAYL